MADTTDSGFHVRVPQRLLLRRLISLVWLLMPAFHPVASADLEDAFYSGLKERGYYDLALQYIDDLARQPHTTDEVRVELDLERAVVRVAQRDSARRQDQRDQFQRQARVAWERFLKNHPQHPQVPTAQVGLGNIILSNARQQLWRLSHSVDDDNIAPVARQLNVARSLFQTAGDRFKAQLDELPFVNVDEDRAAWERRRKIEARYLGAWLSEISCIYEQSLMSEADSNAREQLLNDAIEQLQQINSFSRASAAGLHAQLMLGKCWQGLGDISRALGFFDQLRSQPSADDYIQHLSRTAEYYRLICLNHESREDHQLVVTEATQWLRQHPTAKNTEAGLGIVFEKAVASEVLAGVGNLSANDKELRLRTALADYELAAAVLSPVQQSARQAAARLREDLGQERKEARDFDSAFDRGREVIGQLQSIRDLIADADTDEQRQQAVQQQEIMTAEAGRLFGRALALRKPDSDQSAVAQAEYLLCYVHLQQQQGFDALILARHVMQKHKQHAAETAADAAELAVSAAMQIWAASPPDNRTFELNLIREVCEEVVAGFPGSRTATDARMRLGRIYLDQGNPSLAAQTFLQVPQNDAGYAAAQIQAGQAWWLAWAQAGSRSANSSSDAVPPETRQRWRQQAQSLLTEGIRLGREKQTGDQLSDDVVRAEVSLCGILNQDGLFSETVRRLSEGDVTVLDSIHVEEERPERGVRSAAFAGLCYRTLLRAYVGTQDITAALDVMRRLEQLGASNTNAIYTQLGRELQRELELLQQDGDAEQLQTVRQSFEQFLEQVYASRDRSNTGALLWIGETYSGLAAGQSASVDARQAWDKASTIYRELLQAGIDDATSAAVKSRLVNIERERGDYESAVTLATEILTANPVAVTIQMEAAHALADWGEHSEPQRLLDSISGVPPDSSEKIIWGWAALARRLQQSDQTDRPQALRQLFLEARFELSRSRLRYARVAPSGATKQLNAASVEVMSMARGLLEAEQDWWEKFDRLSQDIQAELGQPAVALQRPGASAAAANQTQDGSEVIAVQGAPIDSGPAAAPAVTHINTPMFVGGIVLVGIVVTGVCFLLMRQPRKRARRAIQMPPETFMLPDNLTAAAAPVAGGLPRKQTGNAPGQRRRKPAARTTSDTDSRTRGVSNGNADGKPTATSASPPPRRRKRKRPPAQDAGDDQSVL